jgi:hypothetical protein
MSKYKFTKPKATYLCQVTIDGETYYCKIKQGQTATPCYYPDTKTIKWTIKDTPVVEDK